MSDMPQDTKEVAPLERDTYTVPALAQGLRILSLFSREQITLGAPDVVQKLGIPRASAFRMLHTLEQMRFLVRDGEKRFRLGPALLSVGFEYLASLDLVEIAQPIMRDLRDRTGLSAHMAIRDRDEVVYVIRHAARSSVSSSVRIGTRFPVHATVMGRMLLCETSRAELEELFPVPQLPAYSAQTPKTLDDLISMLAEDRARGFAVSQSFFERGVSTVASPVRDVTGKIVASINVTAVDASISLDVLEGEMKDAVLNASQQISAWLKQEVSEEMIATPRHRS